MRIYVASSWRNEFQPGIVSVLQAMGHEVYDFRNPSAGTHFSWTQIDPNWESWTGEESKAALLHPLAQRGFRSDFEAMQRADACVMVLPCGRSAHTEAGWMKGAGKMVFVFQPTAQEPELMYKLYDGILTSVEALRQLFERYDNAFFRRPLTTAGKIHNY